MAFSRDARSFGNAVRVDAMRIAQGSLLDLEYNRRLLPGFNLVLGLKRQLHDSFVPDNKTKNLSGDLVRYNGSYFGFYFSIGRPALASSHGLLGYRFIKYQESGTWTRAIVDFNTGKSKNYLVPTNVADHAFDMFYRIRYYRYVLDLGGSIVYRIRKFNYGIIPDSYGVQHHEDNITLYQINIKAGVLF